MKKIISLILMALIILSLYGCNDLPSDTVDSKETAPDDLHNSSYFGENLATKYSAIANYRSFEEILTSVTDIVIGGYAYMSADDGKYYRNFVVIESLRGDDIPKEIEVSFTPVECVIYGTDITYSTSDITYEQGKRYLLLLRRRTSVLKDEPTFSFADSSLIIPFESVEDRIVKKEDAMLYGTNLTQHIETKDLSRSIDSDSFIEYILKATKDNPYDIGSPYIKETDMESVISGSDMVFEITVDSIDDSVYIGDWATYYCTIVSIYKGSSTSKSIRIALLAGSAEVGDTKIVALNSSSGGKLSISSKNSVFDVSQKEEILDILNN